jgi:formylglycine-generating enzyme required for sulfatase activity
MPEEPDKNGAKKPKKKRKKMSPEELADIQKRFNKHRNETREGGQAAEFAVIRQRQKLIVLASAVIGIFAVGLLYEFVGGPPPKPPPQPIVPGELAKIFGDEANLPDGCTEVADARYAPLTDLAEGSAIAQKTQISVVNDSKLPLEIENSVGMRMRLIPPGSFVMGSPKTELGRGPDEKEHPAIIREAFYLGKFEVTQAQWDKVMGAATNPSYFKQDGANRPVEEVTWTQCVEFCKALAKLEGVPMGSYRLPTEAEWEYACRANTTARFACGNTRDELKAFADFSWNNKKKTNIVGKRRANAWGLHDMHGNVWEWCRDPFYYYGNSDVTDTSTRILRGGNWFLTAEDCRSASRFRYPPATHSNMLGFRVVRVIKLGGK